MLLNLTHVTRKLPLLMSGIAALCSSAVFAADTLPNAGDSTLVANIPGSFAVSAAGAAQYSLPVVMPVGTAGVAPSLSINYDSGSGSGLLGTGWSVGGLSSIHRCAQTLAQDGQRTTIELDSSDRFCMDGQRLLAVTGNYGADQTIYRTEVDSFSKIVSYGTQGGGPAYFKVWTKSGEIREYGVTADARVEAANGANSVVQHWALNKISDTVNDTAGNYFTISYFEDSVAGEHRPLRIDYTGNVQQNLAPYASIIYEYEDRPDSSFGYLAGSIISSNKRLKALTSYDGVTLLRRYAFDYYATDLENPRSRLSQVRECTNLAETLCVAPTLIEWQTTDFDLAAPVVISPSTNIHSDGALGARTIDFNGDGISDLLYAKDENTNLLIDLYDANGSVTQLNTGHTFVNEGKQIIVMDYDGNGTTDILFPGNISTIPDPEGEQNDLPAIDDWILLQTNGSTFESTTVALQAAGQSSNLTEGTFYARTGAPVVFDIDGDGLHDILYESFGGGQHDFVSQIVLLKNPGNGALFEASTITLSGNITDPRLKNYRVIDMNGDGMQDLFHVSDTVYLSDGNGFDIVSLNWGNPDSDEAIMPIDINGDGFQDMLWFDHKNVYYRLNEGGTNTTSGVGSYGPQREAATTYEKWDITFLGGNTSETLNINIDDQKEAFFAKPLDFNNDGLMDFMTPISGYPNWWVFVAERDGANGINFDGFYTDIPKKTLKADKNIQAGDFNGDGLLDMLYVAGRQWNLRLGAGDKGGLVKRITASRGYGDNAIDITYNALPQTGVHTQSTDADFPRHRDLQAPMQVVIATTQNNGIGGTNQKTYHYAGAKLDTDGRGFLGFQKQTITDVVSGLTETTHYQQTYPGIGLPLIKTKTLNGVLLSRESYQYDYQWQGTINDSPVFAFADLSISCSFEYNDGLTLNPHATDCNDVTTGQALNTAVTDTDYDAYGNATRVDVLTIDSTGTYRKTTTNSYDDNVSRWRLGRLSNSSVVHSGGQAGNTFQTRQSSFSYFPDSGMLNTEQLETGSDALTKTYTLGNFGNRQAEMISATGITSRTTTTNYDAQGRYPLSSTNTLGHTETYLHNNPYGKRTQLTGPNQLSTQWQYDELGRLRRETRANQMASTVTYSWCANDCPTNAVYKTLNEETGSADSWTYFDVLDRSMRSTTLGFGGQTIIVDMEYNARGQEIRASRPYFEGNTPKWATSTYDATGRVKQINSPVNGITTNTYDGLTTSVTNALNQKTTTTQNSLGHRLTVKDANNYIITYQYDAVGNLVKTIDADNNVITNTYNIRGEKESMDDPDMGFWTYDYNVLGELIQQTDAENKITTLQYDLLGRMTQRQSGSHVETYTYDTQPKGIGKLTSASSTNPKNTYLRVQEYDNLGRARKTSTTLDGITYTGGFVYDGYSRLKERYFPGGQDVAVRYTYNTLGYLKYVSDLTDGAYHWEGKSANADGNFTLETIGGIDTLQTYNSSTGRLTGIYSGDGDIQNIGVDFDALGNLTQRENLRLGNTQETFGYDKLNRLKTINYTIDSITGVQTVTYDALGNIETKNDKVYGYGNQPHAASVVGGVGYYYDDNGSITSDGTGRSFAWSYDNKPTRISKGNTELTFAYGPERARFSQVVDRGTSRDVTTYVGDYERIVYSETRTEHRHKIAAGNRQVAIKLLNAAGGNPGSDPTLFLPESDTPTSVPPLYPPDITPPPAPPPFMPPPAFKGGTFVVLFTGEAILIDGTEILATTSALQSAVETAIQTNKQNSTLVLTSAATGPVTVSIDEVGEIRVTDGPDGSLIVTFKGFQQSSEIFPINIFDDSAGQLWVTYTGDENDTDPDAPTNPNNPPPETGEGESSVRYLHLDHLGSVDVITDATGKVIDRLSYDAFGLRRQADWVTPSSPRSGIEPRGFTGHEHLDEVGIIHMNGRIYDPNIGRFLSADPYIQFPGNMQSFNRYSYVLNNPLSYTDPSGHFVFGIIAGYLAYQAGGAVAWGIAGSYAISTTAFTVIQVAVTAATSAVAMGVASEIQGGTFADGFQAGVINGLAIGAFTAIGSSAFGSAMGDTTIGLGSEITIQRIVAHGMVGGVTSDIQGGKFADGFISAALTKSVSGGIQGLAGKGSALGVVVAATVGGTISELAGGKFANGATTAAFGYIFNQSEGELESTPGRRLANAAKIFGNSSAAAVDFVDENGVTMVLAVAPVGRLASLWRFLGFGGKGLPIVKSAQAKLGTLAEKFGKTPDTILEQGLKGKRFRDLKNGGNINIFSPRPDGKSGYLRITLDPNSERVISSGLNKARDVSRGIDKGRFEPL